MAKRKKKGHANEAKADFVARAELGARVRPEPKAGLEARARRA
jgi:hypothetical protein